MTSVARWLAALTSLAPLQPRPLAADEVFFAEARILSPVRVRVPDSKKEGRPPLVVGLHGRGGTAQALAGVWEAFRDPKPVLVVPEAPYPLLVRAEQSTMGWSWDFPSSDRTLWAQADPLVVRYVLDVAREARKKHVTGGVYLLGHSQGVAYAYMAAVQDPDLVSGIIAFAGILPSEVLSEDSLRAVAGKLRVFIAHGQQDEALDPKESKRAKDILSRLGFSVTYREFQGGHGLSSDALRQAQAWMADGERMRLRDVGPREDTLR